MVLVVTVKSNFKDDVAVTFCEGDFSSSVFTMQNHQWLDFVTRNQHHSHKGVVVGP